MERKSMNKKVSFLACLGMISLVLYVASQWWEREFATLLWTQTSPDGCVRLDTYKPFWLLPSWLRRIPHADPEITNPLGMPWDLPIFEKAYEVDTGTFLGESIIYDGSSSQNYMAWNDSRAPGRRIIISGGFLVADTDRCADKITLQKLKDYYKKEAEKNRARLKSLEAKNQQNGIGNVPNEPDVSD